MGHGSLQQKPECSKCGFAWQSVQGGLVAEAEGGPAGTPEWNLCPEALDREELERFGTILDHRPASLRCQNT